MCNSSSWFSMKNEAKETGRRMEMWSSNPCTGHSQQSYFEQPYTKINGSLEYWFCSLTVEWGVRKMMNVVEAAGEERE